MRPVAYGVLLSAVLLGCEPEPDIIENERLDAWCGESQLCAWENTGRIERVGTWWPSDWGVSLVDDPTLISQLSFEGQAYGCVRVRTLADVEPGVAVTFEVDLQDDGSVDGSYAIAAQDFQLVEHEIRLPYEGWIDYARFTVRKEGAGRAVLAQAFVDRISSSPSACRSQPLMPEWDGPPPADAGLGVDGGGDGDADDAGR